MAADGHRHLRDVARQLSVADAHVHLAEPAAWATLVLGRTPTASELTRARIVLDLQANPRGEALVAAVVDGDVPRFLCLLCKQKRPGEWNGSRFAAPDPCDGFECGVMGRAKAEPPPTGPALDAAIRDCRHAIWAWGAADPAYAAKFRHLLGALELTRGALELIATRTDIDPAEVAQQALDVEGELAPLEEPTLLLPDLPDFQEGDDDPWTWEQMGLLDDDEDVAM